MESRAEMSVLRNTWLIFHSYLPVAHQQTRDAKSVTNLTAPHFEVHTTRVVLVQHWRLPRSSHFLCPLLLPFSIYSPSAR
ncbi:hypothetical protein ACTXT7_016048 [Hymenolepis weldensis]